MSAEGDDQVPLLDRVENPQHETIPKDAARDLALLENDIINAEVQLLRQSIPVLRPLYARRSALVSSKLKDSDFWPRVFSNTPQDVDEYIRPSDAEILATTLKNVELERFEVNEKGEGEPRSVRLVFEFENDDENRWFTDTKLVKDFSWRKEITRTSTGKRRVWEGLVSDPVRIHWKKGMDPTHGLLDAACDLADAEKALLKKESKETLTDEERMNLPEYEKLVEKMASIEAQVENEGEGDDEEDDDVTPAGVSFFAWFGYRGAAVTAKQSEIAMKDDAKKWEKIAKGEKVDEDEEEDNDDDDEDALSGAEIFPDGESVTIALSEDVWPNALKFYVQSYGVADEFDDLDLENLMGGSDEDDDEDDEEKEPEQTPERPRKKVKT
ncbi:hypothetical protein FQN57_000651 [Myotisia sp. PD_48]|nr:hypothetical protein FQN57_000651 [Myotisia sp. PD_48]